MLIYQLFECAYHIQGAVFFSIIGLKMVEVGNCNQKLIASMWELVNIFSYKK